ncbi:hypothetical protein OIU76_022459 [Salix suchowensis]|nr:hypothetical protein OIU76_022459 [Salix suchowensis]
MYLGLPIPGLGPLGGGIGSAISNGGNEGGGGSAIGGGSDSSGGEASFGNDDGNAKQAFWWRNWFCKKTGEGPDKRGAKKQSLKWQSIDVRKASLL